jgi:hypothetical protein
LLLSSLFLNTRTQRLAQDRRQNSGWPEYAELWPDPTDHGNGEEDSTNLLFAYRKSP